MVEAKLESETILFNFDNSFAVSSPEIVFSAISSATIYFPSDEISIERDTPMMPPECVIFIVHSFSVALGVGKLVLSGMGVDVENGEQLVMSTVISSTNKEIFLVM